MIELDVCVCVCAVVLCAFLHLHMFVMRARTSAQNGRWALSLLQQLLLVLFLLLLSSDEFIVFIVVVCAGLLLIYQDALLLDTAAADCDSGGMLSIGIVVDDTAGAQNGTSSSIWSPQHSPRLQATDLWFSRLCQCVKIRATTTTTAAHQPSPHTTIRTQHCGYYEVSCGNTTAVMTLQPDGPVCSHNDEPQRLDWEVLVPNSHR
jgi:hypothetical protein